jgi:hypothetical protein
MLGYFTEKSAVENPLTCKSPAPVRGPQQEGTGWGWEGPLAPPTPLEIFPFPRNNRDLQKIRVRGEVIGREMGWLHPARKRPTPEDN